MADAFTGEIRIFGGNFTPRKWALCNGQIMAISQSTALFSILGTNFGGDGRTTFMMPNLCGRTPIGTGHGPGLTYRRIGSSVGSEIAGIDERYMPNHRHKINVSKENADLEAPETDSVLAIATKPGKKKPKAFPAYSLPKPQTHAMNQAMVSTSPGAAQTTHENRQPYLAMNFIICLDGIYPSRT